MSKIAQQYPSKKVFAVSLNYPEERVSATPGDYWDFPQNYTLKDSAGDPMALACEEVTLVDALTGEIL